MLTALLALHGLTHAAIGLLPRLFFQRGRLTPRWWITAAPFIANGAILALAVVGLAPAAAPAGSGLAALGATASVACALGAVALLFFTLGTHRVPLALWHQADDAPHHIVTWGAYARIRHPFYAAFILALLGAFALLPSWATAATLLAGVLQLDRTAAREESRLAASAFGAEYRTYMTQTGRFVPRRRGAA